ncbi:hypothetical protein [Nocardia gipuzkoensis]|uniref:hypothetical protein n=1 Tax=Nocardia gipuzkoensis TaxID=2749991 RepID=UPI003EE15691
MKNISATWRREADDIGKMPWSAMTEATGDGSDVLALVRGMADPAQQAMTSIATRFTTLADLLDKYSANIQDKDTEISAEIGKLSPR